MIKYLKDEKLEDLLDDNKVIVDFYADWCMPCNMLGENIEELIEENKTLNVVKINIDEHQDLAREYGVMSIPYLILFNNKNLEKKHVGFMEKEELIDWLK